MNKSYAEIVKLQQAKVLLTGGTASTGRAPGRPNTNKVVSRILAVTSTKLLKRMMGAAGKAKIAEAQKARWAKLKRANKKAVAAKVVKSGTSTQS